MPVSLAMSVGTAKTIAVIAVVVFVVGTIASAWLFKNIAQKAAMATIFALLTLLVWTQRTSLVDCQDDIRTAVAENPSSRIDTTCRFLGRDVPITVGGDQE